MKSMKRGIAMLLAVLLVMPTVPAGATETEGIVQTPETETTETGGIIQNPGAETGTEESTGNGEETSVPGTGEGTVDDTETETPEIPETEEGETENTIQTPETEESTADNAEMSVPETEEGIALLSEEISEFGDNAIYFSTGADYQLVVNESVSGNEEYAGYTGVFGTDGSYTIQIPEEDPFFPYEVQFVDQSGESVQNLWFMTPDSTVEFGGHSFRVEANFTGQVITQMSLNIAGDTVTVYPAEKEFGGAAPMSLLPLKERYLGTIDMTGYTPLEMTMVSVDSIFTGTNRLTDTDSIVWKMAYDDDNDYTIVPNGDYINMSYATSFEMIVGEPDQLAADNIRYSVYINSSDSSGWLNPAFYGQAWDGSRTKVDVLDRYWSTYYTNGTDDKKKHCGYESIYLTDNRGLYPEGYFALAIHAGDYEKTKFKTIRAYKGLYVSAAEAMAAEDITTQILCTDMTQAGAGYQMNRYSTCMVTLVSFDELGNVTGCLPVAIHYSDSADSSMEVDWMRNESGSSSITQSQPYSFENNCYYYTNYLYGRNPLDGIYYQKLEYKLGGATYNAGVTAAYVGFYSTIAEAEAAGAADIKAELFGEKGYGADYSKGIYFTIFVNNAETVYYYNFRTAYDSGIKVSLMRNESGSSSITQGQSYSFENNCYYYTNYLYTGNPLDGTYYQQLGYMDNGYSDTSVVTAAYKGRYATIAEAEAAGAVNIRAELFGSKGYGANYSEGIYFTVFIGADGTEGQNVFQYHFVTAYNDSDDVIIDDIALNSGTAVRFYELYGKDGYSVTCHKLQDSYAENNFIVYLVGEDVDRTELALNFAIEPNLKLYAEGSSEPVIIKESLFDFSNGPVQFTASSEDKKHSKNYWVQVISKSDVGGRIFMNSLIDTDAKTETRDGVVYTTREVMLDGLHDYRHDIMLANMGADAIQNLSAELVSDVLELDDYWTLKGNHELSGFTNTSRTTSYGTLSNLAMIRLRKRQEAPTGSDVTGTLTIKSGKTVLMVMNLTGTVSDPAITTEEIPAAVKYVPYGTMIQNSNKYSWNETSYQMVSGVLPEGMEIMPNGELYGVPREMGEFTFTVLMTNSYSKFYNSVKEFTLVVMENTDENVDGETSEGYNLTERVSYNYSDSLGDQTMTSQGEFGEFVDLWLDGVKLERDVDYRAESGSTRITIYAQTLAGDREDGTHTLGVEFRDSSEELKRAAQNYVLGEDIVKDDNPSDNGGSGGNTFWGGGSGGNSALSGGDSGSGSEPSIVYHTVARGENLWNISVKYFGNGNRWRQIYEDNRDILRNPNRLYVGQVLVIYINAESVSGRTVSANAAGILVGNTYTVRPGDSLWKIAALVYENGLKWKKIYEVNLDRISDASKIRIGQTLVIPE